ncbi:hypothetical protein ABT072_09530 [Streptomyces sp. NPDC002589]|uniref:hypothetical protein n=1 Tax=Streptomyces sp. NPDC002589 TaxID=3154420 RepID=UPI0033197A1A
MRREFLGVGGASSPGGADPAHRQRVRRRGPHQTRRQGQVDAAQVGGYHPGADGADARHHAGRRGTGTAARAPGRAAGARTPTPSAPARSAPARSAPARSAPALGPVLDGVPALIDLFDAHAAPAGERALELADLDGPRRFQQGSEVACREFTRADPTDNWSRRLGEERAGCRAGVPLP